MYVFDTKRLAVTFSLSLSLFLPLPLSVSLSFWLKHYDKPWGWYVRSTVYWQPVPDIPSDTLRIWKWTPPEGANVILDELFKYKEKWPWEKTP